MRYRIVWTDATVLAVQKVANTVLQIDIKPEGRINAFTAGAHIDVAVIVKDRREVRSYSLVGLPNKLGVYRIAVKKMMISKGGSEFMWSLKKGTRLQISQPMNHFEMAGSHSKVIFLAAGIGVTPLVGMVQKMVKTNASVSMVYLGASESEMPYIKELNACIGNNLIVHSKEKQRKRFNLEALISSVTSDACLYMCGPLQMMNIVSSLWEKEGKPMENLRFETFGVSGLFASQKFKVKVPRLNLELEVGTNQTLLEVLNNAGAPVMYDCNKGECGLCAVDIISCTGAVDHRDFFLSNAQKAENTKICACTSRVVNGSIVVDTAYRGK